MSLRSLVATLLIALVALGWAQTREPPVLEIVAQGMDYELSTDVIPSGWTTIRLRNATDQPHFALFGHMPEGRGVEDSLLEVVPVFQDAIDLIMDGQVDEGFAALGNLPAWYAEVVYTGGPGMISAGATTEVVAFLEPGTYVIECYVKTEEGLFHSTLGMIDEITVTDAGHDAEPPPSDLTVRLSNPVPDDGSAPETGIEMIGTPVAGEQVVEVQFTAEEPPLLANDLHLVRMDDGVRIADVTAWMDWSRPDGLRSPAPARFLGGTQEMPQGRTAYLTVNLEPGSYAWVSERGAATPLYRTFDVR